VRVIDLSLARVVEVDVTGGSFANLSLDGTLLARLVEFDKLAAVGDRHARAGYSVPTPLQPYALQAAFGIVTEPRIEFRFETAENGDLLGWFDGVVRTRTMWSDRRLDRKLRPGLRWLLDQATDIHPTVASRIVDDGRLPSTLTWQVPDAPERYLELRLVPGATAETDGYPVPAGSSRPNIARPFAGDPVADPIISRVLPVLGNAVASGESGRGREAERIAALDGSDPVERFLALMAYNEAVGGAWREACAADGVCDALAGIARDAPGDQLMRQVYGAVQSDAQGRSQQAMLTLMPLYREAPVRRSYLAAVLGGSLGSIANASAESDPERSVALQVQAAEMFADAITRRPHLRPIYYDLGAFLIAAGRAPLAFVVMERALALPSPGAAGDSLDGIGAMRGAVKSAFPWAMPNRP